MTATLPAEQAAALRRLLRELGLAPEACLVPLAGGANNRVFRLAAAGVSLLLKVYFRHPGDARDRLGAELAFCRFAWEHDVPVPPRPLAADAEAGLALFEFIEGRRVSRCEVAAEDVATAVTFYRDLNRCRAEARELPVASGACFSVAEHLQTLERRLARLARVTHPAALVFVREELRPRVDMVRSAVQAQWGPAALPAADRRVSPSDFGFHNALRQPDGRLRFIDFEYAGWDDPAKLVCDFFCQPAVPVPLQYWDSFAATAAEDLSDPPAHLARFAALLPVYRLMWCCILLNDFLPEGRARRSFAGGTPVTAQQQAAQLKKARELLGQTHLTQSDPV